MQKSGTTIPMKQWIHNFANLLCKLFIMVRVLAKTPFVEVWWTDGWKNEIVQSALKTLPVGDLSIKFHSFVENNEVSKIGGNSFSGS